MCGTLEDMLHARQWRPVEQALHDSNDVGLVARARSRLSWSHDAMLSLVVLSAGYMVHTRARRRMRCTRRLYLVRLFKKITIRKMYSKYEYGRQN